MADYDVSSYGIFSDAVNTIKTLNTSVASNVSTLNECKTRLSDGSVFMGPICDSCVQGFGQADAKLNTMTANFTAIANYLMEAASNYQKGDTSASQTILSIKDGTVSTATTTSGQNSGVQTGKEVQDSIYNFLSKEGFNDAAISGILANIQYESSFNPQALGDGGTSYGICQWHKGRWESLKNYCSQNGYDSTTLDGQLHYLVYELKNSYSSVYNKIKSVPNTSQGAYDAAYEWTVHYEIPKNKEQSGQNRGNTAVKNYWAVYGGTGDAATT